MTRLNRTYAREGIVFLDGDSQTYIQGRGGSANGSKGKTNEL